MKENVTTDEKNKKKMGLHLQASLSYFYGAPVAVSGNYNDKALKDLAYELYELVDGGLYEDAGEWDRGACSIDNYVPEGDAKFEAHWDGGWQITEL